MGRQLQRGTDQGQAALHERAGSGARVTCSRCTTQVTVSTLRVAPGGPTRLPGRPGGMPASEAWGLINQLPGAHRADWGAAEAPVQCRPRRCHCWGPWGGSRGASWGLAWGLTWAWGVLVVLVPHWLAHCGPGDARLASAPAAGRVPRKSKTPPRASQGRAQDQGSQHDTRPGIRSAQDRAPPSSPVANPVG